MSGGAIVSRGLCQLNLVRPRKLPSEAGDKTALLAMVAEAQELSDGRFKSDRYNIGGTT